MAEARLEERSEAAPIEEEHPSQETVTVVGAGAWGTVLSWLLADRGYLVKLWVYEPDLVMSIRATRENMAYLPGVFLPRNVLATSSLENALEDTTMIVFAVPSHAARSVLTQMTGHVKDPLPILSIAKGIEGETFMLVTQIMKDVLPSAVHDRLAVLSGPSFAAEVRRRQPTHVVVAAESPEIAGRWRQTLQTQFFRLVLSDDVTGVQLGGALKNIIGLAAGMLDALEFGENTRAALITHGLAEMTRLGAAMGANPKTFFGLSGLGDLILTCTGALSRNRDIGVRVARGRAIETLLKERMSVAEGVNTTKAVMGLAQHYAVDMPIVKAVHSILFEDEEAKPMLTGLLETLTQENSDLSSSVASQV